MLKSHHSRKSNWGLSGRKAAILPSVPTMPIFWIYFKEALLKEHVLLSENVDMIAINKVSIAL